MYIIKDSLDCSYEQIYSPQETHLIDAWLRHPLECNVKVTRDFASNAKRDSRSSSRPPILLADLNFDFFRYAQYNMSPSRSLKRTDTEDGSVSPPPTKRKQPVASGTTQKAVKSFFTPASQKQPEQMTWKVWNDTLLAGEFAPSASQEQARTEDSRSRKIAAFDFDSTLIVPSSGNKFSKGATDWKWWAPTVPTVLKELHDQGYLVAVVSNQAGITMNAKSPKLEMKRLNDFKQKVAAVFSHLDMPICIYAATEKDQFRKPRTGMWTRLLQDHNLEKPDAVDLEGSIFVGDAAGRGSEKGNKDHSCSDRDFAANVGIKFYSPEEYFSKEDARPFVRNFDPANYLAMSIQTGSSIDNPSSIFVKSNPLDIVLFSGSPAAGKSTYYWRHLKPLGYERVNQDILKTRDRCLKVADDLLRENKSVAVDNTNADPEVRAYWVELARKHKVPIRCVLFTADPRLCEHNDVVRSLGEISYPECAPEARDELSSMNPEKRTSLPKSAFYSFTKRYREPTLKEGFQDITKVDFNFEGTPSQRAVWSKYWVS
ncbi:PNK3P-domain-containing protein [Pseudovirgaria hyperparasitica]|uniref:PNK3P-domain-containing protein n=1 Tax=Pseudovirgaria hyperparasitica TaxID=470096 RepID=A0A6A6WA97_9PEZI|nr:PNK3P-domain-containing protein [Pseudovirgaria hyperparasitica]KAF2759782.1 PNK3P-domain-containing protein [Pseudovirgaria hyperparasitica]